MSGEGGDAFGLPPFVTLSTVWRWEPCGRYRELVRLPCLPSAPACSRDVQEGGLGWHTCHCPGRSACLSVQQQQGGVGVSGWGSSAPLAEKRAVVRRGKDEADIAGGIPGCEERSLLS